MLRWMALRHALFNGTILRDDEMTLTARVGRDRMGRKRHGKKAAKPDPNEALHAMLGQMSDRNQACAACVLKFAVPTPTDPDTVRERVLHRLGKSMPVIHVLPSLT